jgi:putative membrane protein
VEARSSAEVVIVVRPASGSYLAADLIAGIAMALVWLWFQLFSPWEFRLEWILAGPPLLGAATALAVSRAPGVRRRLTPSARRRDAVRSAACAVFLDRGVDRTRGRTGLLVYVSLLERRAEVVADRGIESAVPATEWKARVAALVDGVARGEPGRALAARLVELGDLLAAALPRSAEDVDELSNEVVA